MRSPVLFDRGPFPSGALVRLGLAIGLLLSCVARGAAEDFDFSAELMEPPLWDHALDLRVGGGYKDNLLLSNISREESGSISAGLDYTVFRLPLDGAQVFFLLAADHTSYPNGDEVKDEQLALAAGQFKKTLSPDWRVALDAQYVYQNQVFDASITEADVHTVQVRGNRFEARPSLRRYWGKPFWTEIGAIGHRQMFDGAVLDDFWEGGARMVAGFDYRHRSEATLSYTPLRRYYDSREHFTRAGAAVPGTSLEYSIHSLELAFRHHFDEKRRWRWTSRLGYERVEDNGPGYFDYSRYQIRQQMLHRGERWEFRGSARWNLYRYEHQTAGAGDSGKRDRTGWSLGVRVEREVFQWLRLFAEFEHERVLSNERLDRYRVNTVTAGVQLAVF